MKILVVMGTRPEAIKLAPVVAALRRRKGLETVVLSTGQHRELLDQVLKVFGLRPDRDLRLMRRGQSPEAVSARVQKAMAPLLARLKPGLVVVQGDTTTALAAALAAARRGIPVAHVEAGLRSFDPANPFPEEINRTVIDHLSALHFPPTPVGRENLAREGLTGRGVRVVGNTVVDALRWAVRRNGADAARSGGPREVLVTLHRRESFGKPLEGVFRAIRAVAEKRKDAVFVFPVHPNPRVRAAADRLLRHPRVKLVSPLPYDEFVRLMGRVEFLLTDSGGLQEESACLGKPVLVVRETTERPEIIASGAGRLVGLRPAAIERWTTRLLDDAALRRRMSRAKNPYGDGRAAERVAAAIAAWSKTPAAR